jgi:hypothetical protein
VEEERTSVQEEKAVEVITEAIAETVTVVIKAEDHLTVINQAVMMKIVGIRIQAIVQDLHTEIRTDFKLKHIG